MILVAGQQSSGNRLIERQIRAGITAAGTDEIVQIWHGSQPHAPCPVKETLRVVIPVRSEAMRRRSVDVNHKGPIRFADGTKLPSYPEGAERQRATVFKELGTLGVPIYLLSYEALVRYPEPEGRLLFDWLGLPWVPWHTALYDANEKHET